MISNRRYKKNGSLPELAARNFASQISTYVKRIVAHRGLGKAYRVARVQRLAQLQLSFKVCARKRNPRRLGRRTRRGVTLR